MLTILPQTEIHIDTDSITKLEILCLDGGSVEVRVHMVDTADAQLFAFEDKAAAINFCQKIWLRRRRRNREDGQFRLLRLRLAEDGSQRP